MRFRCGHYPFSMFIYASLAAAILRLSHGPVRADQRISASITSFLGDITTITPKDRDVFTTDVAPPAPERWLRFAADR
jgi:hypothetical protein